jgi:hypothetical protein
LVVIGYMVVIGYLVVIGYMVVIRCTDWKWQTFHKFRTNFITQGCMESIALRKRKRLTDKTLMKGGMRICHPNFLSKQKYCFQNPEN